MPTVLSPLDFNSRDDKKAVQFHCNLLLSQVCKKDHLALSEVLYRRVSVLTKNGLIIVCFMSLRRYRSYIFSGQ